MDQWQESACFLPNIPDNTLKRVVCDPLKDLVWVGGSAGVVCSYFGPLLRPYTSFVVDSPVLDLQVGDKYVYTLTASYLFCHKRTGQIVSKHAAQGCFLLLFESDILVASPQRIFRHNVDTMQETGTFSIDTPEPTTTILFLKRCAPFGIVVGLSNGTTQVIDIQSFEVLYTIRCHSGPLTDLDCKKSVVMTCGLSSRRYGIVADQIVYVWDVRVRKPLPPLNLVDGAEFVRIHPRSPTNCMVISKSGQLHFMDAKNPSNITIRQIAVQSQIVGMDVFSSGDALVVIEDNGYIHYWCRSTPTSADLTPKKLELPSIPDANMPQILEGMPLSSVGLPYYNQELLSSWSDGLVFSVGMPAPSDPTRGNIALTYKSIYETKARRSSVTAPSFISQRERLGLIEDTNEDLFEKDDSLEKGKVPRAWRKQEILFSKYGVQDFDFRFFNKSNYAGLENERPGSNVLNAVIQLLRWCPLLHNGALDILARNSDQPLPIIGELAILFDMLHKAGGRQCRASNFHTYLSSQPEVLAMGLLEPVTPISMLIPGLLRYFLHSMFNEEQGLSAAIHDACSVKYNCRVYGSCGYRQDITEIGASIDSLASDLKGINSALSSTTESWSHCPRCDRKHSVSVFRQVYDTSPVLFINVLPQAVNTSGTVPSGISFVPRFDKRSLKCVESDCGDYELQGYIAQIQHDTEMHAVTVVKIGEQWHMFNDFLVTPITAQEAFEFGHNWKQPLLLMYIKQSQVAFDYEGWKQHINRRLLHAAMTVSGNLEAKSSATLLGENEVPKLVALDAEFVLLGQEISEIHSDGSKRLLKPQTMSLARVSVVRASEEMVPFIDDFIETKEQIKNYLTLYSGIEPGDLDSKTSPHALVTQQTATRRLWILLNLGVVFVGHALVNDFRTINLQVPPDQVLDTAELYYDRELGKSRRMSLKFLIWAVFGDEIQTENHDSIEDAQAALRLYLKYKQLEAEGQFEKTLLQIYDKGQRTGFKVPSIIN